MTTSTSVHSNALNFMSCLNSGVDPRTGLYNVSINLPDLLGNDLRGPGLALGMAYSPLNTQDGGYGLGWSLQLSQYHIGSKILSLSTGETYKVTETDEIGYQLKMEEQKLDSFRFYKQDDSHFRVVHKSGMVEILEIRGSADNPVALPVQIYAASGHRIDLDYQAFSSTQQILRSVKDELGQTLMSLRREGYSIEVLLHPSSGPDGGPLARFVMSLTTSDYRVSRITLPTENEASWRFTYGFEQGNQLCIKQVHTPTGAREEIYYQDTGHEFPQSSGLQPLPRVTRHIIYPGLEQPAVDVRYSYGNNQNRRYNFLGAGLNIAWESNGLDNLYKHYATDYDYVCTESLWVGGIDGGVVRSIERTFNRLHLQTLEVTAQNNNVQIVETTYNIQPGIPYKDQPSDCQMPREIKTTWSVKGTNRIRSETVSNTYDRHGNPLTHTRADGIVETSTWYPAEGGDGCPEDPEGFVRQLKDKTTSPAPSAQGGAPTLCTRYRYSALPALEQSPLSQWLVPVSETQVHLDAESGESQLQQTHIEYFDRPAEPLLHGHIQRRTSILNGQSTISTYDYATLLSPQLGVQVLEATETLSTDFDGVSSKVLRQQSLFSGQDLLIEAQGVQTRYVYDALNRLVRETVAPGTEFEASRQYQYSLCANDNETAEQVLINARNVTTRTVVDGLGRAVFEESDHVDEANPGRFRQTYAARYNSWNNLQEETVHDWLEGQELALSNYYAYDDWGQRCCVTDASGVESHQDLDPIGTVESAGPILRTWLQNTGESPTVSGRSESWLNLFGKTDRVMSLTADNIVLGTLTYLYDGLGRCTEQSDELRHVTTFSYDAWSRLVSSTLPDNSTVSRDYAPHSSAELPVALNVQFPDGVTRILAGEQEFDGLQRLTRIKVGPRSEGYAYEDDRSQVKSRTTAAGDTLEFEYNLLLTDQPVASRAPDESAEFDYDRTSARLTRAKNEQGVRTYDYDSLNRLRSESWRDKQDKVWQTLYVNSLQGRALKRTDFQQDTAPGQDTLYGYDPQGRLETLEQGRIRTSLSYNELSQIRSITTLDRAAGTTLLTELEYDDQGREILRTLTAGAHPARTLEQLWKIDGLLESRHLQQGDETLLKETFHYDSRGRLTRHECSEDSSTLPRDALGREISQQIFIFDALDNLKYSLATFVDKTTERAQFNYAADDPCQLAGITYTPPRATPDPSFTYDANGNQEHDERGQQLTYDSQSRLLSVGPVGQEVSAYSYDSHDHLVTSRSGSASEILRFYQGHQLSGSVQDDRQTHYLYLGDQPLGQQQTDDPNQTLLLLTDPNNSVLGESQQSDLRTAVYNAYGERHSDEELLSQLAFNGEVRDPDSGWYLLGNGYRAYNPSLMRFHSPDSLSPFGAGGLNPYTYCLGNPIALRDPTGHQAAGLSGRPRRYPEDPLPAMTGGGGFMDWIWVAVGVVGTGFTAALTVASFGATTPAFVASVTFLGITTTAATASTVATAALATGTVLGAAATGFEAHRVATGDETSGKIAMGLGFASLPFDIFGGFLKSAVGKAVKRALKATELAATAKASAAVIEDGSDLVPNRFKNPFGNGKMDAGTQTSFDTSSVATQTRKIPQTKVKAAKPVNKTKSSRRVASATSNESATTGTSMAPTSNAGRWPTVTTTGLAGRAEPKTGEFWTRAVENGEWAGQINYSARS